MILTVGSKGSVMVEAASAMKGTPEIVVMFSLRVLVLSVGITDNVFVGAVSVRIVILGKVVKSQRHHVAH